MVVIFSTSELQRVGRTIVFILLCIGLLGLQNAAFAEEKEMDEVLDAIQYRLLLCSSHALLMTTGDSRNSSEYANMGGLFRWMTSAVIEMRTGKATSRGVMMDLVLEEIKTIGKWLSEGEMFRLAGWTGYCAWLKEARDNYDEQVLAEMTKPEPTAKSSLAEQNAYGREYNELWEPRTSMLLRHAIDLAIDIDLPLEVNPSEMSTAQLKELSFYELLKLDGLSNKEALRQTRLLAEQLYSDPMTESETLGLDYKSMIKSLREQLK